MNEIKQGWRPLLAATLGTMCGIFAFTNYTQGFFVGPVTSEFGWAPSQFFLSYTVLMCLGLITGPVIGSLAVKYGIRVLGMIGLAGHAREMADADTCSSRAAAAIVWPSRAPSR